MSDSLHFFRTVSFDSHSHSIMYRAQLHSSRKTNFAPPKHQFPSPISTSFKNPFNTSPTSCLFSRCAYIVGRYSTLPKSSHSVSQHAIKHPCTSHAAHSCASGTPPPERQNGSLASRKRTRKPPARQNNSWPAG